MCLSVSELEFPDLDPELNVAVRSRRRTRISSHRRIPLWNAGVDSIAENSNSNLVRLQRSQLHLHIRLEANLQRQPILLLQIRSERVRGI